MNKSEMIKKTETIENQAKELLAQVNALNTEAGAALQTARRLESRLLEKERAEKEEQREKEKAERLREFLESDQSSGYVSDAAEQEKELAPKAEPVPEEPEKPENTEKTEAAPEKVITPVQEEKTIPEKEQDKPVQEAEPEQPKPEQPRTEQPRTEQPRTEQPRTEQPRLEQPRVRTEKPRSEMARTEAPRDNRRTGDRPARTDDRQSRSDNRAPRADGNRQPRTEQRTDNRADRRSNSDRAPRNQDMMGKDKDAYDKPRNQTQRQQQNRKPSEQLPIVTKEVRTPENKGNYVRTFDTEKKAKNKKTIMKETAPSARNWEDDGQGFGSRKRKNQKPEVQKTKPAPVVIDKAVITTETISVRDFSEKIGKPASEIIKKLFMMGIVANINQDIDFDTCSLVAMDYNIELEQQVAKTFEEAMQENADVADTEESLVSRPPVVTIMGHVDHGKTSLLDAIRNSSVTEGEAGGITQHIGAYTVNCNGRTITFIDTPGHEAFTAMRARGAQVTDVVILVVAADDGIMPQTIEAINHAKAAEVPIVVAINKIDKPEANPERIKQQLTEYGLVCEDWGGDTICVPVSAKKHINLDKLLEMVLLQSDVLELRANPNRAAKGTIIEAQLDKGRGPVATVLVQNGTLKVGDPIVAGIAYGKVRAMMDDKGRVVKSAGPSQPVEVLGFNEVPSAGDIMNVAEVSKKVAEERRNKLKAEQLKSMSKVSLEDLFSHIAEGDIKNLNIVVKADVHGSVEAVKQALEKLSNEEVRVKCIHGGVGAITESDVMFASASNAIVIGFNVRPDSGARALADQEKVDVRTYRIIYQAIEDVENAMKGMFKPVYKEVHLGTISVRNTFKVSGVGVIAGAYVQEGKVQRSALVRVVRDGIVIHEGQIASLRRFKDDVKEVAAGYECGIGIENFNDIRENDSIEAYIMEQVAR